VPAAQQALPIDGLDHVTHTDDLDVVDHAAQLNALRRGRGRRVRGDQFRGNPLWDPRAVGCPSTPVP
jgi:hypothetical protein